jgi:cytochrome c peroxidase
MKSYSTSKCIALASSVALGSFVLSTISQSQQQPAPGETPLITQHINESDIEKGRWTLDQLFAAGKFFFSTNFTILDGFGRPGATGNGAPSHRTIGSAPFMIRTSAPDSNSCAGCHNVPEVGGSGDFVANVFVLAQVLDPVVDSVSSQFSDERNTLGMHGSGAIEMLAREMTTDLIAIRTAAIAQAASSGQNVTKTLITKDVNFGSITAHADGSVDTSQVVGVDATLIIKPFHQKGVVVSVREFSNNAFNHHHGLEAVERFGVGRTGSDDFDGDGIKDELSVGDVTAAVIFQVALGNPTRVMPPQREWNAVQRGEKLFKDIGCADCHKPVMILNNPVYSEPNPFNPAGNLRPQDVTRPYTFDLTRQGIGPRLERTGDGRAIVRCFTDLKRHVIADESDNFFGNEKVIHAGVPTNQFLTRKLWDVGNSSPYGHRGDCTTIGEAIYHHAGEGKASRDSFMGLSVQDQQAIVKFLKTLQVVKSQQ